MLFQIGVAVLTLSGTFVDLVYPGANTGALTLAGHTPSLALNNVIRNPIVGTLSFTGRVPTVGMNQKIIPVAAGTLRFKGPARPVAGPIAISIGRGTLQFSGPIGSGSSVIAIGRAIVTLTGRTPLALVTRTIAVPRGSLTHSGTFVAVKFQGPLPAALVLTGHAPTVTAGAPGAVTRQIPVGMLTLTGTVPVLKRLVPTGTLTLTGVAPVLNRGSHPATRALTLTGLTPTRSVGSAANVAIPIGRGTLSLTGRLPALTPTSLSFWKLFVGGLDRTRDVIAGSLDIQLGPVNSRSTARFTCTEGFLPSRNEEVIVYAQDGVTKLFGGLILRRRLFGPLPAMDTSWTECECVDFSAYTDWVYTSLTTGGVTASLASVLSSLVSTHLSVYGITLSGTQPVGPTIAAFAWDNIRVADALRELSERTGYILQVSPNKVLSMIPPGSLTAPFVMTNGAPHCQNMSWTDPDTQASNKVSLICGPNGGEFLYVGSVTTDGVFTSWQFDTRGVTSPWNLEENPGSFVFRSVTPFGGGGEYEWDQASYTLQIGTRGSPPAGTVLRLSYWVAYPFRISKATGAAPVIEHVAAAPSILDVPAAKEAATGLLAQVNQSPLELTFQSLDHGWLPGQALTISLSSRAVLASVITAVSIHIETDAFWVYNVTANQSGVFTGSYLDQWRQLTGRGGGSAVSVVTVEGGGGTTATVLSSPAYLGGSRNTVVAGTAGVFAPVVDYVPFFAQGSFTGRIRVSMAARSAGVGVTARLWDITAAGAVMTTSMLTSTTPTGLTATGAITAGHAYRLEVSTNTTGDGAFIIGSLESV